ncbi:recombinase family protein [Paenibacillus oryzisoli]|uniref:Recombinase domain-containing protein n=1 Tax=Paenibacillus oryzisoli TaxID=1850517 RepID=A0A198AKB9_9BACL|nr:recombinase family protein [Paenibacillus oryzisoli]OAS21368.1 hypothetical protein A8708_31365 [Paenibacillus oryzisoli]
MINIKPGSKCALYGRVSTNKQDVENQQKSIEEFVNRYSCIITDEYLDEAVSAFKRKLTDRKNLIKLLNDIPTKKFDCILIFERSRVARNALEHSELRTFFKHANIPVIIVSTESYYDSGDSFTDLIKDATTKLEVAQTSDRTRSVHESLTKKGKLLGGIPPFGYRYNDKKYLVDPQESLMLQQVFDLYKKGLGFDSLAKKMPEKSYRGENWHDYHVKAIITNPIYTGKAAMHIRNKYSRASINDRKLWVTGESPNVPPLISQEDWEYCFQLYLMRREGVINPKENTTNFFFKNLIYCKACNTPLNTKDQRTTDKKTGKKYGARVYLCDCGMRVDAEDAHHYVLYYVVNKMIVDGVYGSSQQIHNEIIKGNQTDIEKIEKQIYLLKVNIQENEKKYLKIKTKIDGLLNQAQRIQDNIAIRKRELFEKGMKSDSVNDDQMVVQLNSRNYDLEKILSVFQHYLLETVQENEQINTLITERAEQVDFIKHVLSNFKLWDELFKHFMRIEDSESFNLRRLLSFFIERIEVENDPREENKVSFEIRAKVNLETERFVEIDFRAKPEDYPDFDDKDEQVS